MISVRVVKDSAWSSERATFPLRVTGPFPCVGHESPHYNVTDAVGRVVLGYIYLRDTAETIAALLNAAHAYKAAREPIGEGLTMDSIAETRKLKGAAINV